MLALYVPLGLFALTFRPYAVMDDGQISDQRGVGYGGERTADGGGQLDSGYEEVM